MLGGCQIFDVRHAGTGSFLEKNSIFLEFPLGHGPKYGAIMVLLIVGHLQPFATMSGPRGGYGLA